ncbi:protein FAR1-RELATED SEQUENCE 5-like isoform X2 [Helianthus annuus]|uniref:protein FAR1-RELATED SEQUENCE 5-like isoform X2 n=1 Tax=Helianthus annuus TaxID=4232 RepID=UPI000B8EFDE9|nr:protein FAR1-RELATED SEQUENCE 5-like isoform X2 [Helianthus annuus]
MFYSADEVFQPENENMGDSDLHLNGTNDDEDGVQNCTFTELLSTGIQPDEEFYVHHTPNGTRMWCPNVPIVRGTPTDFKDWSQSVRLYIGDRDAQFVIDHLKERSESLPDFYYDFVVEKGQLRSIFWADEISKINYEVFGDVLAFDATYHTNK